MDLTLEGVLKHHRAKIITGDPYSPYRIVVRRGHLLDDAIEALRFGFDESKHIRVRFVDDPAVDEGGPRREFFMLLMGTISNSGSLIDGPPDRRVLRHNASAFQVIANCFM